VQEFLAPPRIREPSFLNSSVFSSLLPVVLLIGIGWVAGRRGWIGALAVQDLSNLVFMVLAPALLFRTMSAVHVEQLDFGPVLAYFGTAGVVYFAAFFLYGGDRRAAVLALSGIFSNIVMIGVPLIGLAYGEQGQVMLFTLISLHSLVMLSVATLVLEISVLREHQDGASLKRMLSVVWQAVRNTVIHPVPLPIIIGLLFGLTGWSLPAVVDRPLQWLGVAFGPMALLLVGVTLAYSRIGGQWTRALRLALLKVLLHPVAMALLGWLVGLRGPALAIMILVASLPIGANVFLFSQRYKVEQDLITGAVACSTAAGLITLPLVMGLVAWWL